MTCRQYNQRLKSLIKAGSSLVHFTETLLQAYSLIITQLDLNVNNFRQLQNNNPNLSVVMTTYFLEKAAPAGRRRRFEKTAGA
jgi:hypothetical protein